MIYNLIASLINWWRGKDKKDLQAAEELYSMVVESMQRNSKDSSFIHFPDNLEDRRLCEILVADGRFQRNKSGSGYLVAPFKLTSYEVGE